MRADLAQESRPAANGAASNLNYGDTTTVATQRRAWADRLIRRAPRPTPRYGSPEWLALPETDPAKVAAVVVAAECWATDPEYTWIETLYAATACKATEDADYRARAQAHREEWGNLRPCKGAYADRKRAS